MERLLLKKLYTAISMISAFIFVFLFLIMILLGSTSAAGSANAITLQNILSSDEGNQVYTDYFRPAIDEVYTKSNIMIELSWIMTPYLYTDFNKFDKEEISKIAWLCVEKDKEKEKYSKRTFDEYFKDLIKIEKFKNLEKDDLYKFISENEQSNAIYYGNVPNKINDFKKIKITLPVENVPNYYDVGMYDPFNTGMHMHYGIDISVPTGTKLLATFDGVITYNGYDAVGGNMVIISHGELHVLYAHLREPIKKGVNEKVKIGEVIGYSGATGKVTGAHLHFQACAAKTNNPYDSCVAHQAETFFNPKLLWNFDKK